jgi:HSP20 family molecular chaperone IbpA
MRHLHTLSPDSDPTDERGPRTGRRGPGPRGHGRGSRGGRPGPGGGPDGPDGPRRGRGFGRPGGWQQGDLPGADDAEKWFTGRLPDAWFDAVDVTVDREEITVIGTLAGVDPETDAAEAEGRISRFRAETREQRISIAQEAQGRYQRTVSWGARVGGTTALFTHLAVPVMTRLRQPERAVLDTLVDAGVARSRSDALAWSVRLVGEHADTWLAELREAMAEVDKLRAKGPEL